MWDLLPFDLLSHVFFFLPPDSLARATSACRHWHACAEVFISGAGFPAQLHPPWFLALHTRDPAPRCYGYNPILGQWHSLPLDFCPHPLRPIAPVGNLVLCRPPSSSTLLLRLALCNPFAKHYRPLPELNVRRANPAVGVAVHHDAASSSCFQVFVAGGMSESGSYEPTVEMYDSRTDDGWKLLGNMPWELAVRLTVWTQSESVYAGGVLYWVTSARAYSVMGYEVGTGRWVEVKAPEAERLGSAALVRRSGRLTLVGCTAARGASGSCCVWELVEGLKWELVEVVPPELGRRFLEAAPSPSPAGVQGRWDCTKCAGIDGAIYLYRDLASAMLVWRETESNGWEWIWVEGFANSSKVLLEDTTSTTSPIKGVLLHPSLSPPSFYRSLQDK